MATRKLLGERKISITPSAVRYFTRAEDLHAWVTGSAGRARTHQAQRGGNRLRAPVGGTVAQT
ncbi:hypothetical protein [Streptomyces sp. BH105]|uniref:hypothetical protein n=1 Tax=Streptomyces sp. BH105 TaxID=3410408 RepID=UPI003CF339B1